MLKKTHLSNYNISNEINNSNHRLSNNKLFNGILKHDSIKNLKQDGLETNTNYLNNDFTNKRIQLSNKPYFDSNSSSTKYLSLLKNIAANTALINNANSKECSVINNKLFDKLNNGSNSYLSNMYSTTNKNNSQILFNKNKNLINSLKENSLNSSPATTNLGDSCCITDSSSINEPKKDFNTNNNILNSNLSNLIYSCHDSDSGRHSMADSSNSPCSIVPQPPSSNPPDSNDLNKKVNSNTSSNITGTFTSKILSSGNQITFTQNLTDPKTSFSNIATNKPFNLKKSNQDLIDNKMNINNNSHMDNKSNTIRKSRNTINLEC